MSCFLICSLFLYVLLFSLLPFILFETCHKFSSRVSVKKSAPFTGAALAFSSSLSMVTALAVSTAFFKEDMLAWHWALVHVHLPAEPSLHVPVIVTSVAAPSLEERSSWQEQWLALCAAIRHVAPWSTVLAFALPSSLDCPSWALSSSRTPFALFLASLRPRLLLLPMPVDVGAPRAPPSPCQHAQPPPPAPPFPRLL